MLSFFWDSFHVLLMLETQCSFLLVCFFLVVLFFTLVWFGIFLGLCCFLFVLSFSWGLYISICLNINKLCVLCQIKKTGQSKWKQISYNKSLIFMKDNPNVIVVYHHMMIT